MPSWRTPCTILVGALLMHITRIFLTNRWFWHAACDELMNSFRDNMEELKCFGGQCVSSASTRPPVG